MPGIYICFFIVFLFESFVFYQYCSTIFTPKRSTLKRSLFITFVYVIIYVVFFLGHPLINFLFLCLGNFLFLYFFFNATWYMGLFHSIISIIIMSLCESTVILIFPHQYSYSFQSWEDFSIWIIPTALSKFFYFLAMLILQTIFSRQIQTVLKFIPSLFLLIPLGISVYFIFIYIRFGGETQLSSEFSQMLVVGTCLLFILNLSIVILYNYISQKSADYTNLQLLLQREQYISEYYKALITETENKNRFIHDIKKHLQSISILNQNGEAEKINDYINTLIKSSELQTSVRFCNHELLNAIFCRYLMQCQNDNVEFRTDIRKDTCTFLDETDMTSLFCNLLDNALEASRYIPNSFIELSIHQKPETAFTIIALVNSCRESPFSGTDKRLKTSKENKTLHGHGVKIIERVVNRYQGSIDYYYSEENHTFHMIIALKKPRT